MRVASIAAILSLAACAGEDAPCESACYTEAAEACLARTPTISTGFYGCVFVTDDVGEPITQPISQSRVQIFADRTAGPIVVGVSDQDGFYQLAPPPGTYQFCHSGGGTCSLAFEATAGEPRAVDVFHSALTFWQPRE